MIDVSRSESSQIYEQSDESELYSESEDWSVRFANFQKTNLYKKIKFILLGLASIGIIVGVSFAAHRVVSLGISMFPTVLFGILSGVAATCAFSVLVFFTLPTIVVLFKCKVDDNRISVNCNDPRDIGSVKRALLECAATALDCTNVSYVRERNDDQYFSLDECRV
jgi:hypothetical protein